ncbi:MAG: SDR family oxidoreductase [Prevotella sp.]|jgi:NAD(P)-dependent dehydrogenase (short-subunit alcohol dehydrogenase family)|nr:SDR family oxidoreductase [Prevotella sp.]
MDLKLSNKTALVTGSTAGIGYAIAKGLASEGAKVIINGRKAEDVADRIEDLKKETGNENITGITADFSKKEQIDHLIKKIPDVDEVANMVVYVASPLSSATNGAALRVDGGVANYII